MTALERAPFNEVATLLEKLDRQSLEDVLSRHPQFADEVHRGPDAGGQSDKANRTYALERAEFTRELCELIQAAVERRSMSVLSIGRWIERGKLVSIVLGGVFGATTLGAIGLDKQGIIRIAAIATAVVSILNSVIEFFAKRYTAKEIQNAAELRKGAFALSILCNQLAAGLRAQLETDEIVHIMEHCNQVAFDLQERADKL